ncbi:hydrolase [Bacillus sp. JCM 19047]|nr:hydrolase [Bacillus sp. JCM 19047]
MIYEDLMNKLNQHVSKNKNIQETTKEIFKDYNCDHIYTHSFNVAKLAKELAEINNLDVEAAFTAGLLHDISGIIPNNKRISIAEDMNIPILAEERKFPLIIHQKISEVIANKIFNVNNQQVLSAIGCHTTLKGKSDKFDNILFVADKIEWDQAGTPPYLEKILESIDISIYHGSYAYINFLMNQKDQLKVVHPWLLEAYGDLTYKIGKDTNENNLKTLM